MPSHETASEWTHTDGGFFVFRTPLLPFAILSQWPDGLVTANDSCSQASVLEANGERLNLQRRRLCERLRENLQLPEIKEALFLASPTTYAAFDEWLCANDGDRRLEQTLTRYFQRMAGRATPFGLFAGCSIGLVSSHTFLHVPEKHTFRKATRLDMEYLFRLAAAVGAQPHIRSQVTYSRNSSLYRAAGKWRYVRCDFDGGKRLHQLIALEPDEQLDAAIQQVSAAAATVGGLAEVVAAVDPALAVSLAEAIEYVEELVSSQVLVSELSPLITGPDALDDLIVQLRRLNDDDSRRFAATLSDVKAMLQEMDGESLGVEPVKYQRVAKLLETLPVTIDPSHLFQVDLIKSAPGATLSRSVVDLVAEGVRVLYATQPQPHDPFQRFRDDFRARYEGQTVPLADVLDEECGIGFNSSSSPTAENAPLLDGLGLTPRDVLQTAWTSREAFLLPKLLQLAGSKTQVLSLSPSDIRSLTTAEDKPPLPDSLSAVVVVLPECEAGDQPLIYLRGAHGPSGANLVGRFCRADKEIGRHVQDLLEEEQKLRTDAIYAEIVHLPEGRTGNVLSRPLLRELEVVYLGRSGAPKDQQIPITDLTIGLDSHGRVVLRSVRLQREIIPRMTNAHNYTRGHAIYRFLCALQTQGVTGGLSWSWGNLEAAPFLPQMRVGRMILSRARWRIDGVQVASFSDGSFEKGFVALQRWRSEQGVPRFLVLVDGDNELPVDLDNVLSIESFLAIVKNRDAAILFEMIGIQGVLPASGPEGRFVHEAIVPFIRRRASTEAAVGATRTTPGSRRTFAPGSEWIFAKWYMGTATADTVLQAHIPQLTSMLKDAGLVDRWFFIRYSDPAWHLRIRLHAAESRVAEIAAAASSIATTLVDSGIVWKAQLDTYHREVERYGGSKGIEISEEFFWIDSEAVLSLLPLVSRAHENNARWRLCLISWDMLLSDCGLNLEQKQQFTLERRHSYSRLITPSKQLERALGARFRAERSNLDELFGCSEGTSQTPYTEALTVLRTRSENLKVLMSRLQREVGRVESNVSLASVAASYLHMHANRLLRSVHQPQEFVLFDFLTRIYEAQIARKRGRGSHGSVRRRRSQDEGSQTENR